MPEAQPFFSPPRQSVRALPVLGGGILSGAMAAICNELLGQAAVAFLDVPREFAPLHLGGPAFSSLVGGVGASLVLLLAYRLSRQPEVVFQSVAVGVLILSYGPIIALARDPSAIAGTTRTAIGVLGMMHLVAYAVCVPWLMKRARRARVRE